MNDENTEDAHFDEWEEEELASLKSIFTDKIFERFEDLVNHDRDAFNFDLKKAIASVGTEPMDLIMLVNFLRSKVSAAVASGLSVSTDFASQLMTEVLNKDFLSDDINMRPFQPDDELLLVIQELCEIEDEDEVAPAVTFSHSVSSSEAVPTTSPSDVSSAQTIEELRAKVARYEAMISTLVQEDNGSSDSASSAAAPSDDYYFSGYGHISIHETMLRDAPRTSSYAESLLANSAFIRGKVVLDVGCGTGILSLLAAKAGAKKVIGVDLSNIVKKTKHIIERNQYSDIISIVQGTLEEVELPLDDGELVDVIISEWMGYGLYYENMVWYLLCCIHYCTLHLHWIMLAYIYIRISVLFYLQISRCETFLLAIIVSIISHCCCYISFHPC